ncbi:MAG: alpha/beta fold hydrolase, partial [Polyangiales bacterium]
SGGSGSAADAAAGSGGTCGEASAAGGGGDNAAAAGASGSTGAAGTDALPAIPPEKALPLVFVHGFAGSAQQYQSQAMRFIANGYPPERIRAYDHDGAGFDSASFVTGLGQLIDQVLAEFETDKVFLVGHSRGTFVSSSYLGDAGNAAKVAKYIAIDGSACVSNVPCLAPTQAKFPGQKHVEVCTSKESFAMQYEFLLGEQPQVVDIVRQRAPVEIAGRAVNFPANTGRAGTTLKIYPLVAETGARSQAEPIGEFAIGDDGQWGPTLVDPDSFYELELSGSSGVTTHFYGQRFLRSTNLVRLLSGPPDSASRMNTNTGDGHAAITVSRQREWLETDTLEIGTKTATTDQPAVNALTPAAGAALSIGIQIHDDAASPGESSLDALPYFSEQAFQYGVDVYMPASDPPDGTITLTNAPRGDASKLQVLHVPNWQSSKHHIAISFSDFPQN